MGPFSGCGLLMSKCSSFAIIWSIWKEKNDRIFKGFQATVEGIVPLVTLYLSNWLLCKKQFPNLKLDNTARDWKARMMSSPSKERSQFLRVPLPLVP